MKMSNRFYIQPFLMAVAFCLIASSYNFLFFNAPLNGDEPHYLVITSAITDFQSFELTEAYQQEFRLRNLYPSGLAPVDAQPEERNTHAIEGPNGLYSIHGIGLPLILSPLYAIFGPAGAKITLFILFSFCIPVMWSFTKQFSQNNIVISISLIATLFSFTFVTASVQIFPDLITGFILLILIVYFNVFLEQKCISKSSNFNSIKPKITYLAVLVTLAFLPWLHLKNAAPALVGTCALFLVTMQYYGWRLSLLGLFPLFLSLALLAGYNHFAFDNVFGPYTDESSLEFSKNSLVVFLGLHLDQLHGIFLQNPIMVIGLLYLVPFFCWNWRIALLCLTLYISIILPNAMHITAPFGGYSFGGRFTWAAACVFLFPTLFGLSRLANSNKNFFYFFTASIVAFQAYLFLRFSFNGPTSLYNNGMQDWLYASNSYYAPFQRFMPAFYNPSWALDYVTNYLYIILIFCVIGISFFWFILTEKKFLRFAGSYFFFLLSTVIITSIVTAKPHHREGYVIEKTWHYSGRELLTQLGVKTADALSVFSTNHGRGFLTFGPYLSLPRGSYSFEMAFSSTNPTKDIVGTWDVVYYGNGVHHVLSSGQIPGTQGERKTIHGTFSLGNQFKNKHDYPDESYHKVEVRSYFLGNGELSVYSLNIHKIKYL